MSRRQRKKKLIKTSIEREPIRSVAVYDLRKSSRKRFQLIFIIPIYSRCLYPIFVLTSKYTGK